MRWGTLYLMLCAAVSVLAACGGIDQESVPASGTPDATVGDPDSEAWRAISGYLKVIRESPAFDECLTQRPQAEPWKCVRGARSATALGGAVHDWLASEFRGIAGLSVQSQFFPVAAFRPRSYGLVVDFADGSRGVAAFPWYYRGITPPQGVSGALVDVGDGGLLGRLGAGDLQGKIALMRIELFFNSEDGQAEQRLAALRDLGAVAAIVGTDAPDNEIAVQPYDSALGLGGLPTLIVGAQDVERLSAAAGRTATVTIDAEYLNGERSVPANVAGRYGESRNTVAVLPGTDTQNIIVVATPLNAWTAAAGERGPGVGTLVYLARYFAERVRKDGPLPYTLWFVGTGGHEIYGYGIDRFLSCFDPERLVAYLHLGSGLVYAGYRDALIGDASPTPTGGLSQTRTLAVSENPLLQSIATSSFADPVLQPYFALPPSLFVPGENRGPYAMGIPTIGMNGSNAYFRTVRDDESQIVRAALGPMAAAFRDALQGVLDADADAVRASNALAAQLGAALARPRQWTCAAQISEP